MLEVAFILIGIALIVGARRPGLMGEERASMPSERAVNSFHLGFPAIMLTLASVAWIEEVACIGFVVVGLTDLLVGGMLYVTASRKEPAARAKPFERLKARRTLQHGGYLPGRLEALVEIPLLGLVLVLAFASVFQSDAFVTRDPPVTAPDARATVPWEPNGPDRTDALMFSLATLTASDAPADLTVTDAGRWVVLFEVASGLLILIAAFPLVVARLADWEEE